MTAIVPDESSYAAGWASAPPRRESPLRRFGDTLELPPVVAGATPARQRERSATGWARRGLAALSSFALLGIAAATAFLPTSAFEDAWNRVVEIVDPAGASNPTIGDIDAETLDPIMVTGRVDGATELESELPGTRWLVTGVDAGLNVRATPGIGGALVTSLASGTEVEATGLRVDVDGLEWKQIRVGTLIGWVAAGYLTPA